MMATSFWIGIRSVGRPHMISALTSVYHQASSVDGIVIVGKLDDLSKSIVKELRRRMRVICDEGDYDLGTATLKLIELLRYKDLVLFVDDDVLWKNSDVVNVHALLEEAGVVSVLPRQENVSDEWIKRWEKTKVVELHFSMWRGEILKRMWDGHYKALHMLELYKYGGEFFHLTWMLRNMGVERVCIGYRDGPYHMFLIDNNSVWRKATLWEWAIFGKEMKAARNLLDVDKAVCKWNVRMERRTNARG